MICRSLAHGSSHISSSMGRGLGQARRGQSKKFVLLVSPFLDLTSDDRENQTPAYAPLPWIHHTPGRPFRTRSVPGLDNSLQNHQTAQHCQLKPSKLTPGQVQAPTNSPHFQPRRRPHGQLLPSLPPSLA
jgi:acetyl esterase/lipase